VLLVCFFVRSLCFSNATAPTTIYTLSLHDALPILSAVAAVGGGQPTVVGGGEAHLDRELDPPPALLDERPQGTERRDDVRGGQRVLHLSEPHGSALSEHAMRQIGVLAVAGELHREAVEGRSDRRRQATGGADHAVDPVGQQ